MKRTKQSGKKPHIYFPIYTESGSSVLYIKKNPSSCGNVQKFELLVASVAKFLHTCQNILCMHQCLYAWAPKYIQRPGWACTESCTRQLPVTASDRHGAALISWPVTTDTHSCAALGERAGGAHDGGCKVRRKTQTLMNTLEISVIAFGTEDATSCLRPWGHAAAYFPVPSLSLHRGFFLLVLLTFPAEFSDIQRHGPVSVTYFQRDVNINSNFSLTKLLKTKSARFH